jgi:hypothetical protein
MVSIDIRDISVGITFENERVEVRVTMPVREPGYTVTCPMTQSQAEGLGKLLLGMSTLNRTVENE